MSRHEAVQEIVAKLREHGWFNTNSSSSGSGLVASIYGTYCHRDLDWQVHFAAVGEMFVNRYDPESGCTIRVAMTICEEPWFPLGLLELLGLLPLPDAGEEEWVEDYLTTGEPPAMETAAQATQIVAEAINPATYDTERVDAPESV